jgi:hypothetical protein
MHLRHLGLPTGQHAFRVVRLNPAFEKASWNGEANALVLHTFQVHAREPACVDVFADARSQPTFDARPAILFRICHCFENFFLKRVIRLQVTAADFLATA